MTTMITCLKNKEKNFEIELIILYWHTHIYWIYCIQINHTTALSIMRGC